MKPEQTPTDTAPAGADQTTGPDSALPAAPSGDSATAPADPAPTPDVAPAQAPSVVVAPMSRRTKKPLIIGLIIAVVLLVLGSGAAAAYYYVANKPDKILLQALANSFDSKKSKTEHFSGSASFKQADSDTTFEATLTGAADVSGAFDISGELDILVSKLTFDVRTTDSKTYYLKLGGLTAVQELLAASDSPVASYAPLLNALNDQWLELSQNALKEFDGGFQSGALSETDMQKMATIYQQHQFLKVKQALPSEKIGGVDSYHFSVVADATKLKDFLAALKAANISSLKITSEQLNDMKKAIDEAKLDKYPIDVWIAKKTKMFNQVAAKFSQDGASIDLRFTVDSYNKPVNVEKPADAKSLLELLTSGLGLDENLMLSGLEQTGISL